jgi:alpha-beta hydrolase superfamily lysophospholipase
MSETIFAVHGIESHAGWFEPLARALEARGVALIAVDRAGSGRDARPRGDTPGLATWLDEVERGAMATGKKVHLLGHSWGARLALAATLERRASAFASLVLLTPGIFAAPDLPRPDQADVLDAMRRGGSQTFPIGIPDVRFSRAPSVLEYLARDPHRLREVTARFLLEDARLGRSLAAAREFAVPTRLLLAENDAIVDEARTRAWFHAMGGKDIEVFAGAGHLVLLEQTEALAERLVP